MTQPVHTKTQIHTHIQTADFDVSYEYSRLINENEKDGAVVFFVGLVRDFNQGNTVKGLFLEHYPGMTESSLQQLASQAAEKWPLGRIRIIHRVGALSLSDQIVFVGVSSVHRKASFEAAQHIMDTLKSSVPLWKKEQTTIGEVWVKPS